jgi:hypothetical protein
MSTPDLTTRHRQPRTAIGLRSISRADINYDGILQWGAFNDVRIRVWGFATENGYRFVNTRRNPRLSVRADIASAFQYGHREVEGNVTGGIGTAPCHY